jgi:hypothetical protein
VACLVPLAALLLLLRPCPVGPLEVRMQVAVMWKSCKMSSLPVEPKSSVVVALCCVTQSFPSLR